MDTQERIKKATEKMIQDSSCFEELEENFKKALRMFNLTKSDISDRGHEYIDEQIEKEGFND